MNYKPLLLAGLGLAALGLWGCDSDSGRAIDLRVLHINDHHSHLQPNSGSLTLDGKATSVKSGGFPSVAAKIKSLRASGGNVLTLHAGDAITGDLYFTLFKGEADAAMMNQVCFDAFALGNHEFDDGDAGLKKFLDHLRTTGTCGTAILSANVSPSVGVSPLAATSATDYIKPYVVKEFQGEQVGVIGLTIAGKTKESSSPDAGTTFAHEAATAQKYIDELTGRGVNKIILLTHIGYEKDLALAAQLRGVDVIVGGDSHSLLGEGFSAFGLTPAGAYPTRTVDANGKRVCVVQASQYADVVGELNVKFSRSGEVTECGGTPHLLLADTFKRRVDGVDVELTGAEREAVLAAVAAAPELSLVTPDGVAQGVLDGYSTQVDVMKQTVIGSAAETLCLERIPNGGQSKLAGCKEATQSNGSDISNVVAKGFLEMSRTSDICIQNGGGVRIDIPAGDITIGTAYTLLPFANTLTEIRMSGQEIRNVLEDAADFALSGSTGAYPYASGLRWQVDLSQPKGQRFSNIEVNPRVTGAWQPIDIAAEYKVVTNNFLARGQDGYVTFGNLPAERKVETFLDYAQSFVDFVKRETAEGRAIAKLPLAEYSTQSFIDRDGIQR